MYFLNYILLNKMSLLFERHAASLCFLENAPPLIYGCLRKIDSTSVKQMLNLKHTPAAIAMLAFSGVRR